MASASVATYREDRLVHGSLRHGIPRQKFGLGDGGDGGDAKGLRTRIRALARIWETLNGDDKTFRPLPKHTLPTSASPPCRPLKVLKVVYTIVISPPPTYEDSLRDLPPDYTLTDALASAHDAKEARDAPIDPARAEQSQGDSYGADLEGIRSHANKKAAKKAAKDAQRGKWADSDGEENKEEGIDGADGGGGGDQGFGTGGDGNGDPPGGGDGGGDNGDEWFTGGSKTNKKKKKKSSWDDLEDEEQKHEGEELTKAGEGAGEGDTPAGSGNAEADPVDEWGAFATVGKKKKGKKGKVEPEPAPAIEPALNTIDLSLSATADAAAGEAKPDDEWAFGTKKSKKEKKKKNDATTESNAMKFDDVNLNDDKTAAPKLDLDFGLGTGSATENKGSGFSFSGGWGGGWGSGGGNSWNFSGAGDAEADTAKDAGKEDAWNFGSSKKSDKKKGGATGTFDDFNFGDLAGNGGEADIGAAKSDRPAEEEAWGGFSTAGSKKDKKKKKGIVDFEPIGNDVPPPPPPVAVVEDKRAVDDPWASFSTQKGKKGKKGAEPVEPEPEPDPPKPEDEIVEEDFFGGFGTSSKDRKKAKRAAKAAGKEDTSAENHTITALPEPAPAELESVKLDDTDVWGSFGGSKKDRKKSKGVEKDLNENLIIEVPQPPPPAAPAEADKDSFENSWANTGKKSGKKNKKGGVDEILPPRPGEPEPAGDPAGDDWFNGWSKKDVNKPGKTDATTLMPAAVDEPKANGEEDWLGGWKTGTKSKPSKKDKAKGITEINEPTPIASVTQPDSVQEKSAEDEMWSNWTIGKKDKRKSGKKLLDATPPPAPTPPDQGLSDDPAGETGGAADALLDIETSEDPWQFGSKKPVKDSKVKKGVKGEESTLTKSKSKDSKTGADDIIAIVDEASPVLTKDQSKTGSLREEKKSSAKASNGWTSLWGTSSVDPPKSSKDKETREKRATDDTRNKADEAAFAAAFGEDADDIIGIIDEAPAKKSSKDRDSKTSKSDKLSKSGSKSSKKSDPKDDPVAEAPKVDLTVDSTKGKSKGDLKTTDASPSAAAGWGFWSGSLKSAKTATPAPETRKEINGDALANYGPSLTDKKPKMPEVTFLDEGLKSATSPLKSAKDASSKPSKTAASVKGSSIQDRIKALQGESETVAKKSPDAKTSRSKDATSLRLPEPDPVVIPASPDEKKSASRDKKSIASAKSSSLKNKEPSPPRADPLLVPPKPSASPLPGGFPSEDILDFDNMSPNTKASSKDKRASAVKSSRKESRPSKGAADVPSPAPILDDLVGLTEAKLPTPPPDKDSKDDSRGHKKERPKVVRDQGSSSWGFWNATPPAKSSAKKESTRSRDDASSPSKERPAGLERSKSARKASDKDPLEKVSKSSGSDRDAKSASKSRPSTSRGKSFSSMFGTSAPPPSRSRSTREKPSRRHSMAVADTGLSSPPPDIGPKDMSAKAAEVMGVKRSKSTRENTKSRKVPDPYAIDSDDLVMVEGPEDSAKDVSPAKVPPTRNQMKSRKSNRQPTVMSGGLGVADAVMADAPGDSDEAKPDNLAFDVRPPLVKRTTSSAKKTGGLMGGILGAFGSKQTPDGRQSRVYESDDGVTQRKRGSIYEDDGAKRLRRDDRKVSRPRKASEAGGVKDTAPVNDAEDAAAKEARRAERRERRDREAAEEEARVARRHERDEARRAKARQDEERLAKEEEEREARRKEERRARREARRVEEERLAQDEEAKAAERRERRRERERQRMEEESAARPKTSDRRRSYMDTPADDEAQRIRREERRVRRSVEQSAGNDKDRPRTSRRRSEYPAPVGDYFDKRNGEQAPHANGASPAPLADGRPFVKAGGDKTASWVDSINQDPPPPPPVEGTIIDAPAVFSADTAPDPMEESTARELRHKKQRDRDGHVDEDSERRRQRRESRREREYVKSSDGSSHDKRKSYSGYGASQGYDSMGVKTWDGRPAVPQRSDSKAGGWLKKLAGL